MTINLDDLVATVRQLAAEQPDHIARCSYFEGEQPSCIIGHAWDRLGYNAGLLYKDNGNEYAVESALWAANPDWNGLQQVTWLQRVQEAQDRELCWQYAVEEADIEHPLP